MIFLIILAVGCATAIIANITAPMRTKRRQKRMCYKHDLMSQKIKEATRWIADNLRAKGIKVRGGYCICCSLFSPELYECFGAKIIKVDGATEIVVKDFREESVYYTDDNSEAAKKHREKLTNYESLPPVYDGHPQKMEPGNQYSVALWHSCLVCAEPKPEQITDYRNIYATAIRKFSKLEPVRICLGAIPVEPLDREWARNTGVEKHLPEKFFDPCPECGKRKPLDESLYDWFCGVCYECLYKAGREYNIAQSAEK